MQELLIGLALVLVIEGLVYAAFPGSVKTLAARIPDIPEQTLRNFGVIAMFVGFAIVWLIKG